MERDTTMKVSDIMTTDVISLNEDDNLDLAQMEMNLARIRHLPVTRQGVLVGLVTHRDILGAMCSVIAEVDVSEQNELLKMVSVSEIMSREVRTVDVGCEAIEAAKILLESKYGCLPVVADGYRLVGIVTEADFVELALQILEGQEDRSGDDEESREASLRFDPRDE
jgi:CBS domain-containing membrane protein